MIRKRDLDQLQRHLQALDRRERMFQERAGDALPGTSRSVAKRAADSLRAVLPVLEQLRVQPESAAASTAKPAFVVSVEAGGKHGESSLLRWAVAPNHEGRKRLRGQRFACYPINEAGEPAELPPAPAWPFPSSFHQEPTP